jgi:hypothetical protein
MTNQHPLKLAFDLVVLFVLFCVEEVQTVKFWVVLLQAGLTDRMRAHGTLCE